MVADSISDILLTSDPVSSDNLRSDGKPKESIVFVGIDMSLLETYFEEFIAKKTTQNSSVLGWGNFERIPPSHTQISFDSPKVDYSYTFQFLRLVI